ncbi:hypothetical protein NUH16_000226 [Penicillium rubens]|nr:hypothetical protein NUH16_000226 [Penicillium rubens]
MGRGASITVGKFLCHLEGHPGLKAFMRIYHQIPIAGTEYADPDILAQRAVLPEVYGELESLMLLKGCPAVPQFLGHAKKKHKESTDSLLVATHIFLPGEPLTKEFFWSLSRFALEELRSEFRAAYE